jgi:hypothetical protein
VGRDAANLVAPVLCCLCGLAFVLRASPAASAGPFDSPAPPGVRPFSAVGSSRRGAEFWPPYADYQKKTERETPVVVLDPVR